MRQNSKFSIAAIGATNVSTLTASIDTRGFSFARIYCFANSTTAVHTTGANNTLAENDDNSTNWTTISAAGSGTAYTPTTTTVSTALAKIIYEVDLRGRKRYLRPTFGLGATTEPFIAVELSEPADGCATAAEIGTANLSQI
jgi:hypothetical protein